MTPNSSKNIEETIRLFNQFKCFRLIPAELADESTGKIIPFFQYPVLKNHLQVRNAWQIGVDDQDGAVIKQDDSPIIPEDIINPPVKDLLRQKRDYSKK